MSCLAVKGFGKLSLATGRGSVEHFPTHHVEELLGYLLLNQRVPHPRDSLIELLWPHQVPENARGCFSTVLWRLQCLFERLGLEKGAFVSSTYDCVTFAPCAPFEFDVERFLALLESAWSRNRAQARARLLRSALAVYQADLYVGIYADWCLVERERLARKRLRALGELMRLYIQQQLFAEAVETGHAILADDPLREEVYRALMFCHGRMGERAEVAALFRRCADELETELQVLPMRETVEVYQQLMASLLPDSYKGGHRRLVDRAQLAFVEFQQAGDRLHAALDALEYRLPNP